MLFIEISIVDYKILTIGLAVLHKIYTFNDY